MHEHTWLAKAPTVSSRPTVQREAIDPFGRSFMNNLDTKFYTDMHSNTTYGIWVATTFGTCARELNFDDQTM